MKLKHILSGVALFTTSLIIAQSQEDVLLNIEDHNITVSEFMDIYNKNNVEIESVDKKSVDEYLDLYLNFKLKVHDAEVKGYDTASSFKNELKGYVDQLGAPYLVDSQFTEDLIKEAYDRSSYEIKASHILIKVAENASPEDTLIAWQKINDILKKAKAGKDFVELAKENSEDPSVSKNEGSLGYFSAFRMVYPFENMAYNTPVGEVSNPVRTSFGYHILKIEDKIAARGEIKGAHIMVVSNDKSTEEEVEKAKSKINEIYEKLKSGADFTQLANVYSDDRGSAKEGGDLGWFGAGRMVPDFEKEAFALTEIGSYSAPFKTQFGWHIVMLEDKKNLGTYDEEYERLSKKIKGDRRASGSEHALVLKLMKDYSVKVKSKSKNAFYTIIDSSYFTNSWNIDKANGLKAPMITISDKLYGKNKVIITQADFAKYLVSKMRKKTPVSISLLVDKEFQNFIDYSIIEYERTILSEKYPEYKALVTEYHDGILLFEIMEDQVWKKAMNDSAGLAHFFDSTQQNYMWNERLDASLYICDSEKKANQVMDLLKSNKSDSTIESKLNKSSELGVTIRNGKYEKEDETLLENVTWKKGVSMIQNNESFVVVNVKEVIPPTAKELKEVKGLVTSAYQDELDRLWIAELRSKYSYSINKSALK